MLALLGAGTAAHAQAINVTAANNSNDAIYSVNFTTGGITILNTDGGSLHNISSLAFITNSSTTALDLLVADNGGQILRYFGDFPNGPAAGTVVFTSGGTGPANPDGLSVDASSNVYLVNAKPGANSNPQLWRFTASFGAFGTPQLLDNNYGSSEVLNDTLVVGADITPIGAQQPILHAGDLLVLTSSPGAVLVYPGSGNGNGPQPPTPPALLTPSTLITLPVGTIPGGLAFWPGDNTLSNGTLLITTTRGTILQYDLIQGTQGTFASQLGNGQFKIKTGVEFGVPFAYVANNNGGDILRFGSGGAAAGIITSGVQHPQGLAVTNATYAGGNTCQTAAGCDLLGTTQKPVLTHKVPQLLGGNGTLNGNVLEDICLVETDPRLANGGACTTSLAVSSVCGNFNSSATIPATLCGGSGPTGKGFALVKTLSQAYALGSFPFNGVLIFNDSSLTNALPPSPLNPLCNPPKKGVTPHDTLIWAPLSSSEGAVIEGTDMVELTSGCDGGASKGYGLSLFGLGFVLNVADGQPLADYTTAKYTALLNTISGPAGQVPSSMVNESPQVLPTAVAPSCVPTSNCIPTMPAPDGNFTNQLQQCINTSKGAFAKGAAFYDGAARAALAADSQIAAVAQLPPPPANPATPFKPDGDYPNPSGALRMRLQNIFFTINTRINTNQAPPNGDIPSPPPPPLPPSIGGTPSQMVKGGTPYPPFTPTAADFAGNSGNAAHLSFSITNMPSWASFDTTTGTLSGIANPKGTYKNIVITVTDGCASASLTAFQIRVN